VDCAFGGRGVGARCKTHNNRELHCDEFVRGITLKDLAGRIRILPGSAYIAYGLIQQSSSDVAIENGSL